MSDKHALEECIGGQALHREIDMYPASIPNLRDDDADFIRTRDATDEQIRDYIDFLILGSINLVEHARAMKSVDHRALKSPEELGL